jgi:putative transcriptional regulator
VNTKTKTKRGEKKPSRASKHPSVGERVIAGLQQAIAWTKGSSDRVRVTVVQAPVIDVRGVRLGMGLSQARFATKFGFPPATLRNWEQGRS